MRRIALSVGLAVMAALVPAPALAHHADIDACVTSAAVDFCDDTFRAKWRWHTRRRDAVQGAPYLLRFKIPGHGRSDTVEAWVLLGE